jgi:hypothetical protein
MSIPRLGINSEIKGNIDIKPNVLITSKSANLLIDLSKDNILIDNNYLKELYIDGVIEVTTFIIDRSLFRKIKMKNDFTHEIKRGQYSNNFSIHSFISVAKDFILKDKTIDNFYNNIKVYKGQRLSVEFKKNIKLESSFMKSEYDVFCINEIEGNETYVDYSRDKISLKINKAGKDYSLIKSLYYNQTETNKKIAFSVVFGPIILDSLHALKESPEYADKSWAQSFGRHLNIDFSEEDFQKTINPNQSFLNDFKNGELLKESLTSLQKLINTHND